MYFSLRNRLFGVNYRSCTAVIWYDHLNISVYHTLPPNAVEVNLLVFGGYINQNKVKRVKAVYYGEKQQKCEIPNVCRRMIEIYVRNSPNSERSTAAVTDLKQREIYPSFLIYLWTSLYMAVFSRFQPHLQLHVLHKDEQSFVNYPSSDLHYKKNKAARRLTLHEIQSCPRTSVYIFGKIPDDIIQNPICLDE